MLTATRRAARVAVKSWRSLPFPTFSSPARGINTVNIQTAGMLQRHFLSVTHADASAGVCCMQPITHSYELLNATSSKAWKFFFFFFSRPCAQKRVPAFHCQPGICSCPCLAFAVGSRWDCGHKKIAVGVGWHHFSLLNAGVTPPRNANPLNFPMDQLACMPTSSRTVRLMYVHVRVCVCV